MMTVSFDDDATHKETRLITSLNAGETISYATSHVVYLNMP